MFYILEAKLIGAGIATLSLAGVGIGIGLIFSSYYILNLLFILFTINKNVVSNIPSDSNNKENTIEKDSSPNKTDDSTKTDDSNENIGETKDISKHVQSYKKFYLLFILLFILSSMCYYNEECYNLISFIIDIELGIWKNFIITEVDIDYTSEIESTGNNVDIPTTENSLHEGLIDTTDIINLESTQKNSTSIH